MRLKVRGFDIRMIRVFKIAAKEFVSVYRDRLSFSILLVLPIVIVGILGNVLRFELLDLDFAVLDRSNSVDSRSLINELDKSKQFSFAGELGSENEILPAFIKDNMKFVIVVPDNLHRGGEIVVFLDGSDLVLSEAVSQTIYGMIGGGYNARVRFKYNPDLKSEWVPLPGLVMIALIIVSSIMLAMSVNRERERGTARLLLLTPASMGEILVGKALPYLLVSLLHGLSVFGVSLFMFGTGMNFGSATGFFLLTFLFSLNSMVLGLFIASLVKSELELLIGCWLFVFIPNVFFSGFIYPLQSMSSFIIPVARYMPGTLFIEAYKGLVFRETSVGDNSIYLVVLLLQALVLFVVTMYLFKRNFFKK